MGWVALGPGSTSGEDCYGDPRQGWRGWEEGDSETLLDHTAPAIMSFFATTCASLIRRH